MKVLWTRSATRDLWAVEAYIAHDAPGYARQYVAKIIASTRRLRAHPQIGRKVPEADREDVREIIFGNYRILYRPLRDEVQILAVIHARRDLTGMKRKPWDVG